MGASPKDGVKQCERCHAAIERCFTFELHLRKGEMEKVSERARERERERKKEVENSILPERREQRVTLCALNKKVNGLNRERNLLVQHTYVRLGRGAGVLEWIRKTEKDLKSFLIPFSLTLLGHWESGPSLSLSSARRSALRSNLPSF